MQPRPTAADPAAVGGATVTEDATARLREALDELRDYLSDQTAPLLVADSMELLARAPPEYLAAELRSWAASQHQLMHGRFPLGDLLFHAVKKIHLFEELRIFPPERFGPYVDKLAEWVVSILPPGERERLASQFAGLRDLESVRTALLEQIHRPASFDAGGGSGRPAPEGVRLSGALTAEEVGGLKRFALLLARVAPAGGAAGRGVGDEVLRELIVTATEEAGSAGELRERLDSLREVGGAQAGDAEVMRSLSNTIPDWVVHQGDAVTAFPGASFEAMHRIVALEEDRGKAADRWRAMLSSAADQFNEGALARAVTLLELADRLVAEREVDEESANLVRGSAHEWFSEERLRALLPDLARRPLLRRVLAFFPAFAANELIEQLASETDRQRRRLLIGLLEVEGPAARPVLLRRLEATVLESAGRPDTWYLQRNLLVLLNRLTRPAEADPAAELQLASVLSATHFPPPLVREAIVFAGSIALPEAGALLVERLGQVERMLLATAEPPVPVAELWRMLNGLAQALARHGTSSARLALIEHALQRQPRLGDSRARLGELAGVDLSSQPEVVARLLAALRELAPKRVFGLAVGGDEEAMLAVVRALAATASALPEAREALRETATRCASREVGEAAAAAIAPGAEARTADAASPAEVRAAGSPPVALAGDLEVFGLPNLLQSLQQNRASGQLSLRNADARVVAMLRLSHGQLAECVAHGLRGEEAFYQVFENPVAGSFEFASESPRAGESGLELLPLLMESMRRYDELQRARALVPDRSYLRATSLRPTLPAEERDGELVRRIWSRIRTGATVEQCEIIARCDAFRTRRLLAHWTTEGSAELLAASPDAPEGAP